MDHIVTIGLPVRNSGEQIRVALDSLLSQTHQNLKIVISDNCSTDNTFAICQEYAARDTRISLYRQAQDVGPFRNFRFVLFKAESDFFMWASHDDRWSPSFVERNLAMLSTNPQAIASISRVMLVSSGGNLRPARGTAPLQGKPSERLLKFLKRPSEASWLYSVFRTPQLKQSFPEDIDVYGFDYVVLALALTHGEFLEVPEFLLEREQHDFLHYQRAYVSHQNTFWRRWFSGHDLTMKIYEKIPMPLGGGLHRALLLLELRHFAHHAVFRFPWLLRLISSLPIQQPLVRIG